MPESNQKDQRMWPWFASNSVTPQRGESPIKLRNLRQERVYVALQPTLLPKQYIFISAYEKNSSTNKYSEKDKLSIFNSASARAFENKLFPAPVAKRDHRFDGCRNGFKPYVSINNLPAYIGFSLLCLARQGMAYATSRTSKMRASIIPVKRACGLSR